SGSLGHRQPAPRFVRSLRGAARRFHTRAARGNLTTDIFVLDLHAYADDGRLHTLDDVGEIRQRAGTRCRQRLRVGRRIEQGGKMRAGVGRRRDEASDDAQARCRGGRNNGVAPPGGTYTRGKPVDHDATPTAGSTRGNPGSGTQKRSSTVVGTTARHRRIEKSKPENPNVAAPRTEIARTTHCSQRLENATARKQFQPGHAAPQRRTARVKRSLSPVCATRSRNPSPGWRNW